MTQEYYDEKSDQFLDDIQQSAQLVHQAYHFTPENAKNGGHGSLLLRGLHRVDYPQRIVGASWKEMSQNQRNELETLASWKEGLASSLEKKGYTRIVSAYGKFPEGEVRPKRSNSKTDVFLASEIYKIHDNVLQILKDMPEVASTYKLDAPEYVYFVNYAFTQLQDAKLETKLGHGKKESKHVEFAVIDQSAMAMRMVKHLGGKLVATFFECENPDHVRNAGGIVTPEMDLRPRLFGQVAQNRFGRKLEAITNYIQPYLDGDAEARNYCTVLNAYFFALPGQEQVPAIQKLAFLDRFFEVFTEKPIYAHMDDPRVSDMVNDLKKQIVEEHAAAEAQGTKVTSPDFKRSFAHDAMDLGKKTRDAVDRTLKSRQQKAMQLA